LKINLKEREPFSKDFLYNTLEVYQKEKSDDLVIFLLKFFGILLPIIIPDLIL